MTFQITLGAGLVCLFVLLLGVWSKRPPLIAIGKVGASLAFVWAAYHAPTHASYYGVRVAWAVSLALVGDILLLRDARLPFVLALSVFLLGHLAYIDAFLHQGFNARWLGLALLGLLVPGAFVQMWLWPKLASALKAPVLAYLLVITLMLASSIACLPHSVAPVLQVVGAALFYLSDLCVARDAFIVKSRVNSIVGLPLYYAAQWLFVASLGY